MTETDHDVTTVGVSPEADKMLKALCATPLFEREVDVYRLAVAVALTRDLTPLEAAKRETKFNIGTLETPTGQVATLVRALLDGGTERPYAVSQDFAEAGIRFLHAQLVEQNASLHEVFDSTSQTNPKTS